MTVFGQDSHLTGLFTASEQAQPVLKWTKLVPGSLSGCSPERAMLTRGLIFEWMGVFGQDRLSARETPQVEQVVVAARGQERPVG